MEHVQIDNIGDLMSPADVRRPVGKKLGTTDMAINYFELAPDESFAFGYHRHADQEEVFYIQSGSVTFETENGDVVVGTNETIRFEAGEWQQGFNRGDERVVALAIGAPFDAGETEVQRECSACGKQTPQRIESADDVLVTICESCETETGRFT
ncbi:cupin domain-containing protein [Halocatena marina]|uniref:Cupin domain-containing protein n=1 Tax=Halocatena marina TaxID=2934937 RepID=A0ABD5YQ24_9EURY|nr:cupin domain-containing protein [Halocatena marina]